MEWWYPETTDTYVEYIRSGHCQMEEKKPKKSSENYFWQVNERYYELWICFISGKAIYYYLYRCFFKKMNERICWVFCFYKSLVWFSPLSDRNHFFFKAYFISP